jgi:hypothetical protein
VRNDKGWAARRRELQSALLLERPHLADQIPCELIEATTNGVGSKADTARRVRANAARVKREWDASCRRDNVWRCRFAKLEASLLLARPHLAEQEHCGLISAVWATA